MHSKLASIGDAKGSRLLLENSDGCDKTRISLVGPLPFEGEERRVVRELQTAKSWALALRKREHQTAPVCT